MLRMFKPLEAKILVENLSIGLNISVYIPRLIQPLSYHEKQWLKSHTFSDLISVSAYGPNQDNLYLKIMKQLVCSVIANVATDVIISNLYSMQYMKQITDVASDQTLEESSNDVGSKLTENQESEINAAAKEDVGICDKDIAKAAEEITIELSDHINSQNNESGANSPASLDKKDLHLMKDTIKSKVMVDGIKELLSKEIEFSIQKDLRKNILSSQKMAKAEAKELATLSKKELRLISRKAKAKYLEKAKAKLSFMKGFVGGAIEFADAYAEHQDVEKASVQTAKSLAIDAAKEGFIHLLAKAVTYASKNGGKVVEAYGMKYLGAVGMFLEASSLGTDDVYNDSPATFFSKSRVPAPKLIDASLMDQLNRLGK